MISPLVAVASRAALYPIQSIIIIALLVSGAYFHLLDIARNPPPSSVNPDGVDLRRVPVQSTIWARKQNDLWKWTVDPIVDADVRIYVLTSCLWSGETFRPCLGSNRHLRPQCRQTHFG